MHVQTLLTAALVAGSLFAQNPIAYPADTVRLGSGNLTPFGFSSAGTSDEGRWQQLIPSHYLPETACMITGLSVHCQNITAAVTYANITLQLSHTTAATLGTSFSGNLPSPTTVLNANNFTVQWVQRSWVDILFTTPFAYNGTDNLVLSIQKVYDRNTNPGPSIVTHQTTGSPHRTDLVPVRYAFSAFGGGGSTTDIATFSNNSVLSHRLHTDVATTTLRSVSQPSNGIEYAIGTSAEYAVFGAPGTAWAAFLDTALQPPVTLPFFQGRLFVIPSILLASGQVAGGPSLLTLPIPNVQSLVGSYWTMQSATLSPSVLIITMSNVTDFFVRS